MRLMTEHLLPIAIYREGCLDTRVRCAIEQALSLLQRDRDLRLHVLADDWAGVDAMRHRLIERGLLDRISVHSEDVLRCVRCCD